MPGFRRARHHTPRGTGSAILHLHERAAAGASG